MLNSTALYRVYWPFRGFLHQEKNSTSGRRRCVRTLHTRPKRLDAREATWQGSLAPDDTCQRTCSSRREPPVHMRTRRRRAAHWPSGRIMPGQMSSGRRVPRHLCTLRTRSVRAFAIQTQCVSSGRRVSRQIPSRHRVSR